MMALAARGSAGKKRQIRRVAARRAVDCAKWLGKPIEKGGQTLPCEAGMSRRAAPGHLRSCGVHPPTVGLHSKRKKRGDRATAAELCLAERLIVGLVDRLPGDSIIQLL
jgi:hypothetical protein